MGLAINWRILMKTRSQIKLGFFILFYFTCFFLFCSLIIRFNERQFYRRMAAVVAESKEPSNTLYALKEPSKEAISSGISILERYGYDGHLLTWKERAIVLLFALSTICPLFAILFFSQYKHTKFRIQELTKYLKQINSGTYPLHPYETEDEFSLLEDEIYKTVSALKESHNKAVSAKENLAKNMADISHQLKTPLTSLSLIVELMQQYTEKPELKQLTEQMLNQTDHLRSLVISLLNLSRMDAGILQFIPKEIIIEELLFSAAEPILPVLKEKQQTFQMHGNLDCSLFCDIGWTIEGIGNILKNCSEHTPNKGSILVSVFQNPIYTEIQIEDNGEGFTPVELPHLFERFYKGKHSAKDSIGIGLALSKSIIERQNGEIRAENRMEGGARFRIKFYKI